MTRDVEYSTSRYEQAHHRKPRGYRLWYFYFADGRTFSYTGTYSRAKLAAVAHVRTSRRRARTFIQLCA